MRLYHEHPAITSEWYAYGLKASWHYGEPYPVFQFLLEQADKGDLNEAQNGYVYKTWPMFRNAIHEALEAAPPAGTRHLRPRGRAPSVLAPIAGASDGHGSGSIVRDHPFGETERTKGREAEGGKKQAQGIAQTEQRPSGTHFN